MSDSKSKPSEVEEWEETFDLMHRDSPNGAFQDRIVTKEVLKHFISQTITNAVKVERERLVESLKELKTDERKISEFGNWLAESHDEKMLTNAVIDTCIEIIKKQGNE